MIDCFNAVFQEGPRWLVIVSELKSLLITFLGPNSWMPGTVP